MRSCVICRPLAFRAARGLRGLHSLACVRAESQQNACLRFSIHCDLYEYLLKARPTHPTPPTRAPFATDEHGRPALASSLLRCARPNLIRKPFERADESQGIRGSNPGGPLQQSKSKPSALFYANVVICSRYQGNGGQRTLSYLYSHVHDIDPAACRVHLS